MHTTERETYDASEPLISKLVPFSIGEVAENKPLSSKVIRVAPLEASPLLDGELSGASRDHDSEGTDASGAAYAHRLQSSPAIAATWLPLGSMNRQTAPDVRRGELVMLYRFGNLNKYYWTTLWDDLRLRKLETAIYAFSATMDESAEPTADNTYFLEVSTHRGLMHLHTSQANGELCSFDVQINARDGLITIQDSLGNLIQFNSAETRIELKNAQGAHFDLNQKDLFITLPGDFKLECQHSTIDCQQSTINAAASALVKTPTQTVDGKEIVTGRATLQSGFDAPKKSGGAASSVSSLAVTDTFTHEGVHVGKNHTHNGVHGPTSAVVG